MSALISKPGLTGTSVLNIPKDWTPSWFRGIIDSLLKGGDVRNAVGANGITVSGNISSPYATISFGGASAPITGPLILNGYTYGQTTGFAPLIINDQGEYLHVVAGTSGANTQSYQAWYTNAGVRRGYLGFGNITGEVLIVDTDSVTGTISLRTNAVERVGIDAAGQVIVAPPDNATSNGLLVSAHGSDAPAHGAGRAGIFLGQPNNYTVEIFGSSTANQSYGLLLRAGDSSSDFSLTVNNLANSSNYFLIRGDGAIGFNTGTPFLPPTGYGTPTGNVKTSSFPGGSATLLQTSEMVAQLILDLKAYGLLKA